MQPEEHLVTNPFELHKVVTTLAKTEILPITLVSQQIILSSFKNFFSSSYPDVRIIDIAPVIA